MKIGFSVSALIAGVSIAILAISGNIAAGSEARGISVSGQVEETNEQGEVIQEGQLISDPETAYKKGEGLIEEGRFREAFLAFQECLQLSPEYEDARKLAELTQCQGRISLAVVPKEKRTGYSESTESTEAAERFKRGLMLLENPFLDILSLDSEFSGDDKQTISEAGKTGIDLLVFVDVTKVERNSPPLEKEQTRVWEWQVTENGIFADTLIVSEVNGKSFGRYEISYQLVDISSGESLDSYSFADWDSDRVNYAEGVGDHRFFYRQPPPYINKMPDPSSDEYTRLMNRYANSRVDQEQFSADSELSEPDEMIDRMADEAANIFADRVDAFTKTEFDRYPNAGNCSIDEDEEEKQVADSKDGDPPKPAKEAVLSARNIGLPVDEGSVSPFIVNEETIEVENPQQLEDGGFGTDISSPDAYPERRKVCRISVSRIIGGMVVLDAGSDTGIEPGLRAYVFQDAYQEKPVAEGFVSEVLSDSSTATIEISRGVEIEVGMCVKFSR